MPKKKQTRAIVGETSLYLFFLVYEHLHGHMILPPLPMLDTCPSFPSP
jgi:hypothetical protein